MRRYKNWFNFQRFGALALIFSLFYGCAGPNVETARLNQLEREVERLKNENQNIRDNSNNAILADEIRQLRKELLDSRKSENSAGYYNEPNYHPEKNSKKAQYENDVEEFVKGYKYLDAGYDIKLDKKSRTIVANLISYSRNAAGFVYVGNDGGKATEVALKEELNEICGETYGKENVILPGEKGDFIVTRDRILCLEYNKHPRIIVDTKIIFSNKKFVGITEFVMYRISNESAKQYFLKGESS